MKTAKTRRVSPVAVGSALHRLRVLSDLAEHPSRYGEFDGTELAPLVLYCVPDDDRRAASARALAKCYLADWCRAHRAELDAASLSPADRKFAAAWFNLLESLYRFEQLFAEGARRFARPRAA